MTEETRTEIRREGDKAFPDNNENDNSSESSTEETNNDQTRSSDEESKSDANKNGVEETGGDKKDQLANHPRWAERENDWKNRFNEQEKRFSEELAKMRSEFESKSKPSKSESETDEIPDWFGGDADQWKRYSEYMENKLVEKALSKIEGKTQAEKKALEEANNWFLSEVSAIEKDATLNPSGQKIDTDKLLKIALDNELLDTKGRWNYRAAIRIYNSMAQEKPKTNLGDKKELAKNLGADNRGENKQEKLKTSEDFKGKNWNNLL